MKIGVLFSTASAQSVRRLPARMHEDVGTWTLALRRGKFVVVGGVRSRCS